MQLWFEHMLLSYVHMITVREVGACLTFEYVAQFRDATRICGGAGVSLLNEITFNSCRRSEIF